MKGLKQHELYVVPQKERVQQLEATVISWMNKLSPEERLIVGIPQVLGEWTNSIPVVVGPNMQGEFLDWLNECAEHIQGPTYNLPELTAGFICMLIDNDFDPREQPLPDGASKELVGVLTSHSRLLDGLEVKAA
ncbi:MAG TPA: hypothetical protein VN086_01515 [Candidatus Paceibacterota bacterium]|nr:hypothetical protein [Candidatus Paceibacterota bacterium]